MEVLGRKFTILNGVSGLIGTVSRLLAAPHGGAEGSHKSARVESWEW